jgi:uncharacterized membrane protein
MNPLKNVLINQVAKHVLDGNKGSNVLTVALTALLANHINWLLAYAGLQFKDQAAVVELAKAIGIVLVALFGYLVGKYPALAKWAGLAGDVSAQVAKSELTAAQ